MLIFMSCIRRFRSLNLVVYRKVEPDALPFRPFMALIIRVTASRWLMSPLTLPLCTVLLQLLYSVVELGLTGNGTV